MIDLEYLLGNVAQRRGYRTFELSFLQIESPFHPIDLRDRNAGDAKGTKQDYATDR